MVQVLACVSVEAWARDLVALLASSTGLDLACLSELQSATLLVWTLVQDLVSSSDLESVVLTVVMLVQDLASSSDLVLASSLVVVQPRQS